MRLGGRVAGAIDVLADIETRKRPVADALKDWGLAHRFAGSGDRAAIGNIVYDALRMRLSHAWLMDDDGATALAYAVLFRQWGFTPETLQAEFADDRFAPPSPTADNLAAFSSRRLDDAPLYVQGDIPEWIQPSLQANFGERWLAEARALAHRPTLDLRANTLKATRDKVVKALDRSGAKPSRIARNGIRIAAGEGASRLPNVTAELSFQKGWFEVQDEGSQIVADLVQAGEHDQVLDYCAGGGGKTLAMAATMHNKGQIHAYDADRKRLAPIIERLRRAGTRNVQVHDDPRQLEALKNKLDAVLVDAPCTGTGTWRRRPDTKWRLTAKNLEERAVQQQEALTEAAAFVKPGGALLYVTCSVLPEENDRQAEATAQTVVKHYAAVAQAKYQDSLTTAQALDKAIDALIAKPGEATLKAARSAWIAARVPYQQTEVYRFGNPIVDEWEGKVNAWPLDEGLIDYVDASYGTESDENALYTANVIANPKIKVNGQDVDFTEITPETIRNLHEAGEIEANVATGYHAIEFLLWGQDLNGTKAGAGDRPYTDFDKANCTHGNCDRRAAYLKAASTLLLSDLQDMVTAWAPEGEATKHVEADPTTGLTAILTGMGSLSYGELAGERMKLGLLLHDPEEEHDCFSDNTYASHLNDAIGIRSAYTGQYTRTDGTKMTGPSLSDLVAAKDKALDKEMKDKLDATLKAMTAMKDRAQKVEAYDQMIGENNKKGNAVVQKAIDGLIDQTKTVERVIASLDLGKAGRSSSPAARFPMRAPSTSILLASLLSGSLLLTPLMATSGDGSLPSVRSDLNAKDRKRVETVTRPTEDFSKPEQFETMSAGAATTKAIVNGDAFSHFSPNLTFEEEQTFKLGNALFTKLWVSAPSSTQASDGLGPLFNARACQSCHLKDGRGHPPEGASDATSMFLRLARPARTDAEREAIADHRKLNFPDAVYGEQLQDLAVPGLRAEGRMAITYEEIPVTLAGGDVVQLRKPRYSATDLGFGPIEGDVTLSPRVAPPMIGMGLIQAIHEADILAKADPDDRDRNGISGKPALVRDHKSGELKLGRFGFKAQNASVRDQTSTAFAGDLGLSTPDDPFDHGDCTKAQADCLALPTGVQERLGSVEAPDPVLSLVTFYSENLAVPARRKISDPAVLKGKAMFYQAGCADCHTPKFVTRRDAGNKAHAFQLIWPYSDFLLHDMGEGLADGQQVGVADGREWRTQPLWGVMTAAVDGFIRPGYDAFQLSAEQMTAAMETLCAAPSPANLDTARTQFGDLVARWAHIEIVRTGPVIEQNRFERILFYPDRKSTGLKQVQSVLAKADETATDAATVATKSVATQGLGSLEYLLFGSGAETLAEASGDFRCRYGAAVAQNVANVAAEVSDIWDAPNGIQKAWEQPGPDNPVFRTSGEAVTALLGILVHGAETVRDQRIETFYKSASKAKFPKQALFWRSENTWPAVTANVTALGNLLETSGMAALLPERDRPIVAEVKAKLQAMAELSRAMGADLEKAVEDPAEQQKLDRLLADGKAAAMWRGDLIERRSFMKAAGIGFAAALSPRSLMALERTDAVYASGFRAPDGSYGIATVTERGEIVDRIALPARAHGMAFSAATGRAVAFARRPGTFAMVFDPSRQVEPVVISAPEGRHFYGHGHFSPDGRLLYASENDFDNSRGMIGIYDAHDSFRRVGEFDACGIGTHDMTVSDDGSLLVIANGGIETHPDFGRTKLNLDRMEPSLVLLDARSGALIQKHVLPASLRQLSTRHLDISENDRIWFACQWEGARNEAPPLVGWFSKGEALAFVSLPAETTARLGNYVGAIAVNRREGLVGLTSPVGGCLGPAHRADRLISPTAARHPISATMSSTMKRILPTLAFVGGVVAIGSLIGLLNIPGDWYQSLAKPFFNPPNWIFGPVWTVLYVFIGIAGARTWIADRRSGRMRIWFVQMVLNFLWSPAFFGLQAPALGLVVIVPLLIAILAFIRASWRADRLSAWLFVPYALWVAFATALNASIVALN
eukprot:g25336.t1